MRNQKTNYVQTCTISISSAILSVEWLYLVVSTNRTMINAASCGEGCTTIFTDDKARCFREVSQRADQWRRRVGRQVTECSWLRVLPAMSCRRSVQQRALSSYCRYCIVSQQWRWLLVRRLRQSAIRRQRTPLCWTSCVVVVLQTDAGDGSAVIVTDDVELHVVACCCCCCCWWRWSVLSPDTCRYCPLAAAVSFAAVIHTHTRNVP